MKTILSKALEREGLALLSLGGVIGVSCSWIWSLWRQSLKKNKNRKDLETKKFVGIQLGGTNYTVAIGEPILDRNGDIINFRVIKKTNGITYEDPDQAIAQIISFIRSNQSLIKIGGQGQSERELYEYIGIASFGPICLDKGSRAFGSITTTPKLKWRNIDILNRIKSQGLARRFGIDTDVNSCAYAQFKLGNHEQVKQSLAYITVGTGVGVGLIVQGKTVHGLTHPEGGHITYICCY